MGKNWDGKSLMRTQKNAVYIIIAQKADAAAMVCEKQVNVFISPHSKSWYFKLFAALPRVKIKKK